MRALYAIVAATAALGAGTAVARTTAVSGPLLDGLGATKGSVTVRNGQLTVVTIGMPAGVHGVHLHEAGLCQGPDFKSAGGHWNPGMKQHGHNNPMGAHAGDLPNLAVGKDGRGRLKLAVPGDLANPAGLALVVHAAADDYKTDPSGNSGARIACAVLVAPANTAAR